MTDQEKEQLIKDAEQWLIQKPVSLWGRSYSTKATDVHPAAEWFVEQLEEFQAWQQQNDAL